MEIIRARFRIGDRIVLLRPDGSAIDARIDGLEIHSPNPRRDVLIVLKYMAREDVPAGTEVWSSGATV